MLAHEAEELDLASFLASHVQATNGSYTLVFRTGLGEATVLANMVDGSLDSRILGTVTGAQYTLLVICRDQEAAREIEIVSKRRYGIAKKLRIDREDLRRKSDSFVFRK